jgi:phosphoribosylformylglycinamidine (FGAM) synthase PurS component
MNETITKVLSVENSRINDIRAGKYFKLRVLKL